MAADSAPAFAGDQWLDVQHALLDRLRGKLNLIQSPGERDHLAGLALDELYRDRRNKGFPRLSGDQRRAFIIEFFSYDVIEEFLMDPMVEDVMVNAMDPIYVHRTDLGLRATSQRFENSRRLELFVKKLILFGGRTELGAINDLELSGNHHLPGVRGRVNIVLSPLGPQITITRAKERALSILQLIDSGMLNEDLAAQFWLYVEGMGIKPANLLIAGGPGAGKTTLLNALLSFVPPLERLVVIEDTLELNTAFLENCSRLESSRSVTMALLVKNALRMRPDRILVGEVRGEEAHDLMTAVNIGKYCMGTLHASTARETIIRLQNEPMNVPEILLNLVDVFVVLRRLHLGGRVRRVVGDVVETAGLEQRVVLLSNLWTYDHERGTTVETTPSNVYRDRLAQGSGLTPALILREIGRRAQILRLMRAQPKLHEIVETTRFCQRYISNPGQAAAELGTTLPEIDARLPRYIDSKKR